MGHHPLLAQYRVVGMLVGISGNKGKAVYLVIIGTLHVDGALPQVVVYSPGHQALARIGIVDGRDGIRVCLAQQRV